jgi:hypothetical protein
VETGKLSDASVTNAKLADSAVDGAKIASDSVGLSELQRGCFHYFEEPDGCPTSGNAALFPSCDDAPMGSFCKTNGHCTTNAPDNLSNCTDSTGGSVSVWVKGDQRTISIP